MMFLGPKKSLSSPRLKLMALGMAQHTYAQSQVWYHSAIQVPPKLVHGSQTSVVVNLSFLILSQSRVYVLQQRTTTNTVSNNLFCKRYLHRLNVGRYVVETDGADDVSIDTF